MPLLLRPCFFFFNDPATTEISPLPLHDALPISVFFAGISGSSTADAASQSKIFIEAQVKEGYGLSFSIAITAETAVIAIENEDRKSTRLNSSHLVISYAVFCLKKKKT